MLQTILDKILGTPTGGTLDLPHEPELDGAVGVPRLTASVLALVALLLAFDESAEDGLTPADAFSLAKPLGNVVRTLQHYGEIGVEISDLTPHETEKVISEVLADTEHIDNPGVRAIVRKILVALPGHVDIFQTVRQVRAGTFVAPAEIV